jgi:hypothetical protein
MKNINGILAVFMIGIAVNLFSALILQSIKGIRRKNRKLQVSKKLIKQK